MYFPTTILMNIGLKYSGVVSAIQKDQEDEITNFAKAILQIIRHFKFIEGTQKHKLVLQTSQTSAFLSKLTLAAPKGLCKNPECIEKGLTTHYTDYYQIKYLELRQKYSLGCMQTRGLQKNLKTEKKTKTESTLEMKNE